MHHNARIVHNPIFESTVLKIPNHREEGLSTSKKRTTRSLIRKQLSVSVQEPEPESEFIVKRAMKRLETFETSEKSELVDTRYLVPSFLYVNGCFQSQVALALNDVEICSLLPLNDRSS